MASSSQSTKIALWGYGGYGKELYRIISQVYGDIYQVTAIFDRAFEKGSEVYVDGIPVEPPDVLRESFQEGLFSAVLIGTFAPHFYDKMASQLELWDIPIVRLSGNADLVAAESLNDFWSMGFQVEDKGYRLERCQALYCFVDRHGTQELPVFYDGRGHVVRDMWDDSDLTVDLGMFNFATRVDIEPKTVVDLEGTYCAVARFWGKNYWHFTFQHLDQIAVMERAGFEGLYVLPDVSFAHELVELLGLSSNRIFWASEMQDGVVYRFETVLFLHQDDFKYRGNISAAPLVRIAKRIEERAVSGMDLDSYPKRLFVKRIGTRRLLGAEALLEKHGFTTVVPENLTVREQIRYYHAADVVLTPHGANSTNSIYMQPGSVFIEAFSRSWGFPMCVEALLEKDVHYLSVVAGYGPSESNADPNANYRVDSAVLEMAIRNAICLSETRKR